MQAQGGSIGLACDAEWAEAISDSPQDLAASQRRMEFQLAWSVSHGLPTSTRPDEARPHLRERSCSALHCTVLYNTAQGCIGLHAVRQYRDRGPACPFTSVPLVKGQGGLTPGEAHLRLPQTGAAASEGLPAERGPSQLGRGSQDHIGRPRPSQLGRSFQLKGTPVTRAPPSGVPQAPGPLLLRGPTREHMGHPRTCPPKEPPVRTNPCGAWPSPLSYLGVYRRLLDPVFFGDYPASMRAKLGPRLPRFSAQEREQLQGSLDFVGLNHYTSKWVRHDSTRDPQAEDPVGGPDMFWDNCMHLTGKESCMRLVGREYCMYEGVLLLPRG